MEQTIQEIELKPCPFCGGKASLILGANGKTVRYVRCNDCDAIGEKFSATIDCSRFAINAWNKRVPIVLYMKPNGIILSRNKQCPDNEGWRHRFIEQSNGDFVCVSNGPPVIIDMGK